MRLVWEDVGRRITEGSSLADAMAAHGCFAQLVLQLVRVGEQTGTLELVTARAAEILERRRNLRTSLLTALSYPFIVLVAAVGVAVFMVFNVIPKLQKFLATLGRKLPRMTQILVDVTEFLNTYLPHIVVVLLLLIATVTVLYLWPPGRLWIDRVLLRLPVLGGVLRLSGTATFARGLGILVRSGITLLDGLRTVEGLHRNRYLAARVAAAREAVMQGGGLAESLATAGAYMPMLSRMVAVGEATGTLDDVLDEVARFHESQLQATIRWLSLIIEPAVIVVVGGIVGFVYIAFFMALFSAGGGIR
jgi:type IV pilus assembly protein PilC